MTHPKHDAVAALLRAGTPYSQIRTQLHVGNPTIIRVRKAIGMPRDDAAAAPRPTSSGVPTWSTATPKPSP